MTSSPDRGVILFCWSPEAVVTALDLWLEEDPNWRQLPAGMEELEGMDRVLRRDDLSARQAIVFVSDSKEFKYYGVRFDDLGVMGPFSFESDLEIANMSAVSPSGGSAELLAWNSDDPNPENAQSLGQFEIPDGWTVDTDFLVLRIDQNKLGEPQLVKGQEVSEEIVERSERMKEAAVSR